MNDVSVVMPIYNEVEAAAKGVGQVKRELEKLNARWELIAVDDGSIDGTAKALAGIPGIKLIYHHSNRGYGAALKTGILAAQYSSVLIIDADLTYPVEDIPKLVAEIGDNEMVVGARNGTQVHKTFWKRIAKTPIHWLANYLVGFKIPDLNSGLRIFNRDLAKKYFKILPNGFSFTSNITLAFLSDGYRVKYIPINYFERAGVSKVRPFADAINYLTLVVRMILFYNPLKVFIPIAGLFFLSSAATFAYDIFVLDNFGEKSVILFTAFVQVAILGLLADLINKRTSD